MRFLKIVTVIAVLFMSVPAFAAWTVSVTLEGPYDWQMGHQMYVIKYDCTSDASASGDITLSTQLDTTYGTVLGGAFMERIKSGVVFYVKYDPDGTDTPTSAAQITLDDETGWNFFDSTVATAATAEGWKGDVDSSDRMVPITELVLASSTLANTKKAVIYVWILR